jgi:hypothetical protein
MMVLPVALVPISILVPDVLAIVVVVLLMALVMHLVKSDIL